MRCLSGVNKEVLDAIKDFPSFAERAGEFAWSNEHPATMQVNIGLKCNIACKHCHHECSPSRTEEMSKETLQACLDLFKARDFKIFDITGGAPEMNENFEWFITECKKLTQNVMVRSNLCILAEEQYAHFIDKYAELGVTIVASLPHYKKELSEKQRGQHTFDPTIEILQKLCDAGYGREGSGLELNLVYNPTGATMPNQTALEAEYHKRLKEDFGIEFNHLFAITNAPIGRFGSRLIKAEQMESYMQKLIDAFNPATLPGLMCRDQVSIGWDGKIYDCDFNYACDLPCGDGRTVFSLLEDPSISMRHEMVLPNYCYMCAAGAGSSCGGATA